MKNNRKALLIATIFLLAFFIVFLFFKNAVLFPFLSKGGTQISFVVTALLALILGIIVVRSQFSVRHKRKLFAALLIFVLLRVGVILAYRHTEVIFLSVPEFIVIVSLYALGLMMFLQVLEATQ